MIYPIRDLLSPDAISDKVRIDSKGRISIPAWMRRNFLLLEGSEVELRLNLKRNLILLVFVNGQDSVIDSTRVCEALGPDSKGVGRLKIIEQSRQSGISGPDPEKIVLREEVKK